MIFTWFLAIFVVKFWLTWMFKNRFSDIFRRLFLQGDSWTLLDHLLCLGVSGIWGWGNWATLRVSAVMQMLGIVVSCCHTPYGCFLKWWYPRNTPKWLFLVGKLHGFVGESHHFRSCPHMTLYTFKPCSFYKKKRSQDTYFQPQPNDWSSSSSISFSSCFPAILKRAWNHWKPKKKKRNGRIPGFLL